MKVIKQNVVKDLCSCHFCDKGEISKSGTQLVYPYEYVYEITSERGNKSRFCADCLNELIQQTGHKTPITKVLDIIEDYRRRLNTVTEEISQNIDHGSVLDQKRKERLETKAGEYRTVIAELERALSI